MMMSELTMNVDWIAVIVGGVAAFLLGWLWYSPKLFGTKWAEGVGIKLGADCVMPVAAMVTQLIGTFLLAWVVGITAAHNALMTVILIVVTIVTLIIANGLFAKKSCNAIAIEASFIVAMAVVMVAVHAIL